MDLIKMLAKNKTLQKTMLGKFKDDMQTAGTSKLLFDFSGEEPEITPIGDNLIIVEKDVFNFYKDFYNQNK